MIPNVFISSTIEDLHHLRDAIRDVIGELGYVPIMSEYGDVGYLPSASAEDSCYLTMRQCQLAVLLIGKRYGPATKTSTSVTHNEFRSARDQQIPVFTLVDNEVIAYKRVFDANKVDSALSIPGMDNAEMTFSLIQEILDSRVNNGFQQYTNVSDARHRLKAQLAHFFGDLLQGRFDPIKAEVKDVLSEIKTLRHELKQENKGDTLRFQRAVRFLLDDKNDSYAGLIEALYESLDLAIPVLIESRTFEEFIEKATGAKPTIQPISEDRPSRFPFKVKAVGIVDVNAAVDESNKYAFIVDKKNHLLINDVGFRVFSKAHQVLLKAAQTGR